MRTQRDCVSHRTTGRKKALGITMIEAMFGMAVLAVATVAGVIAFGEVSSRQSANALLAGMQGFNVDARLYLDSFHDNTLGNSATPVGWSATSIAAAPPKYTCLFDAAAVGSALSSGQPSDCPSTKSATAANNEIDNPNVARLFNFPSVAIADSDGDGVDDLHIAYGNNDAIRMGMVVSPTVLTDLSGANMGGDWGHCNITTTATAPNPVAFALQLAVEDDDVCNHMNNTVGRYDHVLGSKCAAPGTTAANGWPDGKDAALNICYAVTR